MAVTGGPSPSGHGVHRLLVVVVVSLPRGLPGSAGRRMARAHFNPFRTRGPSTVQIVLQDDPKAEVLKLAGTSATDEKKGETTIKIDFSVKGGPKDVPGVYKDDKISFPDGNVWSKL